MNFPIAKYRVVGDSMLPVFPDGTTVLASKLSYFFSSPKKGQLVVITHPENKKPLVKRIAAIQEDKVFVVGDNTTKSQDSREFGWVEMRNILGKVVYTLP